jgi:nitrogen-specific signal transduction histidine kinase
MHKNDILITEAVLSSVIDNVTAAIILVDRDRRVILSNKTTEMITRLPKNHMLGKRGGEVLGCANANISPKGCGFDTRCVFCQVKKQVEKTFEKKDENPLFFTEMELVELGKRYFKISTKYLIVDDKEAVLICMEDVSEAKEKERLKLENLQLETAVQMGGAICHELNQPLMVVSGYVQLLLCERQKTDTDYEFLFQIKAQVERIESITRKLMTINSYCTKTYAGISQIADLNGCAPEEKYALPRR